jgi:hypothetical protein
MNYANEPSVFQESGEDVSAKTRQELIRRYSMIVYDYLAIMNSSDTMKIMDSAKYTVQLGLNAITHIYKIAFCMTKNVATTADLCQKGIYCFIEYIEQTYKLGYANSNGTSSQFDYMDAIVFIYDKTISELRGDGNKSDSDEHTGSSAFTNILSVSQSHQAYGADLLRCKVALEQFGRVASVLVWCSHPTMSVTDQMEIVDAHLIDFLGYAIDSPSDLFLFVETVQETIILMEKTEYMDFLNSLKKQIKKQTKKGQNMDCSMLSACLYLKTLRGFTLKEIAEQEKWKRGIDDLAKFVFRV